MARLKQGSLRGSVTQNVAANRRPQQLTFGQIALRLGLAAAALGSLIGTGWWLWSVGIPQKQAEHLGGFLLEKTKDADFAVKNVIVEGRHQTDRSDLADALDVTVGAPIVAFDPEAALARVEKLPWVAHAIVVRRLPDTIYVHLTEREPKARWQNGGRTVVIDQDGKELPNAKLEEFAPLPLVVGPDAPQAAGAFLAVLKDTPNIARLMQSAVRVSERRWNLYLQPKILVKLPEQRVDKALQRLERLIQEQKILERNFVTVDLRFSERLYLEPGPASPGKDTPSTKEAKP